MQGIIVVFCFSFLFQSLTAQIKWTNVDSLYQPLPASVHVYSTNDSMFDGKPNIAYYLIADLKDKHLLFDADTTSNRRITPSQFYEKNKQPLLVVNCTFFSFETNKSLNLVIKDKKLRAYNIHSVFGRGKDTFTYRHPFAGAIGISKKREADIAWTYTDSSVKNAYATQWSRKPQKDSVQAISFGQIRSMKHALLHKKNYKRTFHKWKMKTAVGGGPVLLQNGQIQIFNNEELKFTGKAINDKHPRTAMGYTKDGRLIILVIEGRYPGIAEGATLNEEAQLLKELDCWEALNLDGGGSSCMLVNGKITITPSEKGEQRPVPAVFLIHSK